MMTLANLYIISAPSGVGKTSLVRALLESVTQLEASVSYTTRCPRAGEREGVDYHFVDEAQFEKLIEEETLLEYAKVFGNYYGSFRPWVMEKLKSGIDVILEIDWQGACQIRSKMPLSNSIFILPPSWEVLENRLRQRGQDGEASITKRLTQAKEELSHHAEYDYLIINANFSEALADLNAIIRVHRLHGAVQRSEQADLLAKLLT